MNGALPAHEKYLNGVPDKITVVKDDYQTVGEAEMFDAILVNITMSVIKDNVIFVRPSGRKGILLLSNFL
jgi:hypothetical protein